MSEPLLTEAAVADLLGVSTRTVRSWISRKGLPHYRIGRLVRFRSGEIERWLRRFHEGRAGSLPSNAWPLATPALDRPRADTVA